MSEVGSQSETYKYQMCGHVIPILSTIVLSDTHNSWIYILLFSKYTNLSGGCNTLLVLIYGAAKSLIGVAELSLPLTFERPPVTPIFTVSTFCKGAVLSLDVHPKNR